MQKATNRAQAPAPQIRLSVLDRLMAPVAPRLVLRRLTARVSTANLLRLYDGAGKGRATDGWRSAGTSADAEIIAAARTLRDRMRDLCRNNPTAIKAKSVLISNFVGAGIRPRAKLKSKAQNKKIDALFERWSKECDADGQTDFYGLQSLAVSEMIEGGEVFALRRFRRASDGLAVPLQIQLMEADHLDESKNEDRPGVRIRSGIEYNGIGQRIAYHLFRDHPGDNVPGIGKRFESDRIEASRVLHLFERQRVQSRGVPWGVPAMRAMRDIDDWQNAELVRKKTEACIIGVVFSDSEEVTSVAPLVKDSEGNTIEQFEPGLIAYAHGGKDIKFNSPASTASVREWHSTMLHIVAAGWRMPYELLTGDLREVNFSSSRVGLNEFRRLIDAIQWQLLIPRLLEPIWRMFCEAAYAAGEISTPDVPVEWAPPKFESVNPLQDAQTDLLETRAGFVSPQQMIAKRGYDPAQIAAEWKEWADLIDELKLVFDADPRHVSKGGQAQTNDPLNPPDQSGQQGTGETPPPAKEATP